MATAYSVSSTGGQSAERVGAAAVQRDLSQSIATVLPFRPDRAFEQQKADKCNSRSARRRASAAGTGRNGCSICRVAAWAIVYRKAADGRDERGMVVCRLPFDDRDVIRDPERRPGLGVHTQHP